MDKVKFGHSNFDMFYNGFRVYKVRAQTCYSKLSYAKAGVKADRLVVYHNKDVLKKIPRIREYGNYIINSEWVGGVFITKNFDEGMENGFEIDITQPFSYMLSGMNFLRMPFECYQSSYCKPSSWTYPLFRDEGFTIKESVFLNNRYSFIDGEFCKQGFNYNHLPINPHSGLESFRKSGYVYDPKETSLFEGVPKARRGISCTWVHKLLEYSGFSLDDIRRDLQTAHERLKGV